MQFDSLAALLDMGGHGAFVWSAYALTLVTLVALIVVPLQRRRRFFAEQRGIELRRANRPQSSSNPSTPGTQTH